MALAFFIFVPIFAVIAACICLGFHFLKHRQKQQIRSMLRNAEASAAEQRNPELLRPAAGEDGLAKLLRHVRFSQHLALMLDQAGSGSTPSKVMFSCIVTGAFGLVLGFKLHFSLSPQITGSAGGVLGLLAPLVLVIRNRNKAVREFEKQLPDALDFLSRSMRAGHGFAVALEMLATDSPDPLGRAFRRVSNDLALGSSLESALGRLNVLVPIVDVQFFVSSVCLQQETGGNLGEILTKLAYIIRERFRLKGQVKAVSAHGRVTGLVLLLMPVGVAGFLLLTNPGYLAGMAAHPIGKMMIYGALGGQVVGYFVIKKIIDIKV